jgi:hypothetical protein
VTMLIGVRWIAAAADDDATQKDRQQPIVLDWTALVAYLFYSTVLL